MALQLGVNLVRKDFEYCMEISRGEMDQAPFSRCSECNGTGVARSALQVKVGEWTDQLLVKRPPPDPTLDQAPVDTEQVLEDTAFILERLSNEKHFLFLGDDDYHSLVLSKIAPWLDITVLEADNRIVASINKLADSEELRVTAILYNAFDSVPEGIAGECDAFFTDPPYSPLGVHLFAQRGFEALGEKLGAWGIMALPMTALPVQVRLMIGSFQEYIIRNGFAILDVLPACKVSPHPKGIVSGLMRFERISDVRWSGPKFPPNSLYQHFY